MVRSGQISNSSKLVTWKYEKDPIKTAEKKWQQRFPHYKSIGDFSDTQGHLTPPSVVRSGLTLKSTELSCTSSLPASIKMIGLKTAEKKWQHHFPHFNPMGVFCCLGNQSSDPIWHKTSCSLSPTQMMLQMKFNCDRSACHGDIHV